MPQRRRSDGDPLGWDYYEADGLSIGEAHGNGLPFEMTDKEANRVMKELKARQKRRIKPGFQLPKEET